MTACERSIAPETQHHVLVVSEGPNGEDLDADVNWALSGPCSPQCAVWYECGVDGCEPTEDQEDDGEYERHGRHHQPIEGRWMIESGDCGLACSDSGAQSMEEIASAKGPGVWAVDTDYHGDGDWYAVAGDRVGP